MAVSSEAAFKRWRIKNYPNNLTSRSEQKHREEWEESKEAASFADAQQIRNTRKTEKDLYKDAGLRRGGR